MRDPGQAIARVPAPRQVPGIPAHAGQVIALEQPPSGGEFRGEIGGSERLAFGCGGSTGEPLSALGNVAPPSLRSHVLPQRSISTSRPIWPCSRLRQRFRLLTSEGYRRPRWTYCKAGSWPGVCKVMMGDVATAVSPKSRIFWGYFRIGTVLTRRAARCGCRSAVGALEPTRSFGQHVRFEGRRAEVASRPTADPRPNARRGRLRVDCCGDNADCHTRLRMTFYDVLSK